MPDTFLPDTSFEERNATPDGAYVKCFDEFTRDANSLSQLEYYSDIMGATKPWNPHGFATEFYNPAEPERENVVTLFGEVLDEREGTRLGSRTEEILSLVRVSLHNLW